MHKFAVIGLGNFGTSVAVTLAEKGAEVIAIDNNIRPVQEIQDRVSYSVRLDSTDENALKSQGLAEVDTAIVSIGDFEANLLTTILLQLIGVKRVIARAVTPLQGQILELIGADRVIFPEVEMGKKLAQTLLSEGVIDKIPLSDEYSLVQVEAPKSFHGKMVKDLTLREKRNLNIVAIKKRCVTFSEDGNENITEKIEGIPKPTEVIKSGDILLLFGNNKDIEKFTEEE